MMKYRHVLTVLSILCILYGFLILSIGSGTAFFAVWFLIAAVLLAVSLPGRFSLLSLWKNIPPSAAFLLKTILAAGILVFAVIEGRILTAGFFHADLSYHSDHTLLADRFQGTMVNAEPDYLIVFGAQVYEDGPSRILRLRLNAARDYLLLHPSVICIVSGGQGPNEPFPEARGMKDFLVSEGIDENRILEEPDSSTTAENLRNCQAFLNPETDTVALVTNNFHLCRVLILAKQAGYRNVIGIAAGSHPLYLPNNLLREFFGMIKDLVFQTGKG